LSVRRAARRRVDMRIRMCILNEEGTTDPGRSRKEKKIIYGIKLREGEKL